MLSAKVVVKLGAQKLSSMLPLPLNPLKFLMGQNVKPPFSNIHAGTFKLYFGSGRIADGNHRMRGPVTKSP